MSRADSGLREVARGLRLGLLVAIGAAGHGPTQASTPDWVRYLDSEVIDKIQLQGYRRLGFHDHQVTGDREAYDALNYSGLGGRRFTDIGMLRVSGRRVLRALNFEATVLDSRFIDPQGQRWSVDVARGPWSLKFGDIQGQLLNTNRFLAFDRSLQGVQAGFRQGRFEARVVQSVAKGSARTITISGNNSAGPFYLQNSQIVPGSERVQVDGQDMRLGTNYVINYELGSVTFVDRSIPLTSTVVVTYEAFGFNARRGVVEGTAASYDLGRVGRLGVTAMRQRARTGGAASTRLERFQGFGAPSTPYFLQFEPLRAAGVTMRVDGVLQVENIDYVFDPDNAAIFYFMRFVPASSTIDVVYTPIPRTTVEGDRDSLGIDYRLPLGPNGSRGELSFEIAQGRLTNSATPLSGTARGARLNWQDGIARLTGAVRDIPQGFVSVESRSFNRNERAHEWNLTLEPKGALRYGLGQTNSAIRTRSVDAHGASTFLGARATIVRAYAETVGDGASQRWRVEHARQASSNRQGPSRVDSTSLTTSQRVGGINWRLMLDRQHGYGPSSRPGTRSSFRLNGGRLSASYIPSSSVSTQVTFGLSDVNVDGRRSTGRDTNFGATWNPSNQWSLRGSYALSDSGRIATLGGFAGGAGIGFDGNGFTGGSGATGPILGSTNVEATQFSAVYTPSERWSVSVGWFGQRSTGSVTSNSRTTSVGLAVTGDLGSGHQVAASLDRSATSFADSPLRSEATTYGLFLSGRPAGRWTYAVGANFQISGGTRQFAQDSAWLEGSLTYQLAPRHLFTFAANGGTTRGYLPQDSFEGGLTYSYRIWRTLTLDVSYRVRDVRNRDATQVSGAYRSRGFDVELNFLFDR